MSEKMTPLSEKLAEVQEQQSSLKTQKDRILESKAPVHRLSDGTGYKGFPGHTWIKLDY